MNSVHDMGGMEGLGPLVREAGEPVFHARWEARVFALDLSLAPRLGNRRPARERIPAADYLRMGYYEIRHAGFVTRMQERGMVSAAELRTGRAVGPRAAPPPDATGTLAALRRGSPATRDVQVAAGFAVGQAVLARNLHPQGHTRLPRYVRGRRGTIARDHGVHVFPDSAVQGQGEQPQHLYSVRFAARELWGGAAGARDTVYLDLWEAYLELA